LGYQPELHRCLIGGEEILPAKNYFSFRRGGLVCHKCHRRNNQAVAISNNAIKILRLIISRSHQELEKVKIDKRLAASLDRLLDDFLNFSQEQELGANKFLLPYLNLV